MEKSVQSWHRRLAFFHHLITLFALAARSAESSGRICLAVFSFRLIISNFLGVPPAD